MRRCYLVCYDIRNPNRLRRVHRVLRGYGEVWQYSVFYCVLTDIDRVRLESDLKHQMNLKDDRAVIIDMGSNDKTARQAVTVLGEPLPEPDGSVLVV